MRIFLFFSFFLFFVPHLTAAPVGNPASPELIREGICIPKESWIQIRAGYEGDFVSDAKMKQAEESSGVVDRYQQGTNGGLILCNLLDRVDLYGILGSSRTETNWRFIDANDTIHQVAISTFYNFLWGIAGRAILHQWDHLIIGTTGSFRHAIYHPSTATLDAVNLSTTDTHLLWEEWQVGLDLSYNIGLLTPYIGTKYSHTEATIGNFSQPIAANGSGTTHMRNRSSWGIFIGCALTTGAYFLLNIEGRLIDEEAIAISGEFRF